MFILLLLIILIIINISIELFCSYADTVGGSS